MKIRYRCCTCGEPFSNVDRAIHHMRAGKEHGYQKHSVEPVETCIMCPGREECLQKKAEGG